MARSASGTRRFTSVDLPTPEWPSSTVTLSASSGATASSGSSRPAIAMVRSRSANCAANGSGGARSVFVRHRIGVQPAGVGGDQCAFDETGARRRVGQRDHDQQLIGVGDDDALGRDRCHRRCAATPFAGHRAARCAPGCPACPDRSPTMPTSSPTTIGVRPSSRARMAVTTPVGVAAERASPPPAVDRHHHGLLGVGVVGPGLGARPGAPTRAGSGRRTRRTPVASALMPGIVDWPASMSAHIRGNSGSVLAVVPMSSTSTPGTRSPTIAPAVAIR